MRRLLHMLLDGEGVLGGIERHVLQIISGLNPSEYEVGVVTWDIPEFVRELRSRDIPVLAVTSSHIIDVGLTRHLTRYIHEGDYDLIHIHGHRAGLLGRVAAARAHARAVLWTCHLADNKAERNAVLSAAYGKALRWLDRYTDLTIAVSPDLAQWLRARGIPPDKIEVVLNCVDLDRFKPVARDGPVIESLGLSPEQPIVGTVGRLTHQKGIDTLLDAAGRIAARHPDVQFLVVGSGPKENDLRARAAELGLAERVVFAGERTDVPTIMPAFDVLVLPSRSEGWSYVPMEAMACRKPVICSDIPSHRDLLVDARAGLLVPVEDADGFADAIHRLLDDPAEARQLADSGYDLVRRKFSLPVMQEHTRAIYDRLIAGD